MFPEREKRAHERDEEAANWCLKLAKGHRVDRADLNRWIEADASNAAALDDAMAVWQGSGAAAETSEMLEMRATALGMLRTERSRRFVWSGWRAAALAAAILMVVSMGSWLTFVRSTQVYHTGTGERQLVTLADGSTISLDASTMVEVMLQDDHRDLRLLSGRAKFDVAKDPLRPFTVTAGGKVVVATGTAFSVELLQKKMHVVLYEGRVEVLRKSDSQSVNRWGVQRPNASAAAVLNPGDELVASLDGADASVHAADPRSLEWEGGQISFNDEPLSSVVERLNRYNPVKIRIADPGAAETPISGVFRAGDAEAFVEGVLATHPLEFDADTHRFRSKGDGK